MHRFDIIFPFPFPDTVTALDSPFLFYYMVCDICIGWTYVHMLDLSVCKLHM